MGIDECGSPKRPSGNLRTAAWRVASTVRRSAKETLASVRASSASPSKRGSGSARASRHAKAWSSQRPCCRAGTRREWVDDLSPKVLERFRVRRRNGQHRAPSLSAMRSLLIRIDPAQLDAALRAWHQTHGSGDTALAIDGKTLRGALDDEGRQAHVLGIVGHDSKTPLEQKKSA